MRNLKRVLSLVMAVAMLIGLMVVSASAASTYDNFTDKDEIVNKEAVNTMVSLGVINGKEDGSYFDPTGIVTRAEMAKLIAVTLNGGKDPLLGTGAVTTQFSDVSSTYWAAPYIAYCANLGIINGKGDGTFGPEEPVTGTAAAKMFLCALGYRSDIEGLTGSGWDLNTDTLANKVGLYDDMNITPSNGLSRDNTAQLIYNGVQADEVEYRNNYGEYSGVIYAQPANGVDNNSTMLWIRFKVVKVEGIVEANEVFGINGRSATVAGKTYLDVVDSTTADGPYPIAMDNDLVGQRVVIYVKYKNALSPNAAESEVLSEPIVSSKTTVVETYARLKDTAAVKDALKGSGLSMPAAGVVHGELFDYNAHTADVAATPATDGVQGTAGVRQRFIDNTGDGTVDLIIQEKCALAKVTVYNESKEKLTLSGIGSVDFADIANYEDVALDDYVLVYNYDDTYYLYVVETVEGEISAYNNNGSNPATITMDGTNYTFSANTNLTVDLDGRDAAAGLDDTMVSDSYRLYLDAAGNIIFAEVIDEALGNYAVITAIDSTPKQGFSTAQVKLTKSDGTSGTYNVDLLASAKRWSAVTNTGNDAAKELAMANALKTLEIASPYVPELVTYTINDDNTVVLGQPKYINSSDYADVTGTLGGSDSNKLYSTDSSYTINGTSVVMDNTTVFFVKDDNGYNVSVGLSSLPSKGVTPNGGSVDAIYEMKTSTNNAGVTNVAKAVFLTVTGTYASSANYAYISSNYSSIKENGDTIYSYDVVFTDGSTGVLKTKSTSALTKGMVYSYTLDSKGYADFDTDTYTVNSVYVDELGNNTVVLLDADNYALSRGSYPLAADIKVWNVEDAADVYATSLGKTSVAALVLNDDLEVKYAFVKEVRGDVMTAEPTALTASLSDVGGSASLAGGGVGSAFNLKGGAALNVTNVEVGDTITVTQNIPATQNIKIQVGATYVAGTASTWVTGTNGAVAATAYPITAADIAAGYVTITTTIATVDTTKGEVNRVITNKVNLAAAPTSNVTFALTDPSPAGTNAITGGGATTDVAVTLDYTQTDFTITATKIAAQTITVGGTDATEVDVVDNATAPTYTIDSLTAGATKSFTLTVSEADKADIVYNVSVTVKSSATTPATAATITFDLSGEGSTSSTASDKLTLTIDSDVGEYTSAAGSETVEASLQALVDDFNGKASNWTAAVNGTTITLTAKTAGSISDPTTKTIVGTGSTWNSVNVTGSFVNGADEVP